MKQVYSVLQSSLFFPTSTPQYIDPIKLFQCDLIEDTSHQSRRHSTISKQYGFQGNNSLFRSKNTEIFSNSDLNEFDG